MNDNKFAYDDIYDWTVNKEENKVKFVFIFKVPTCETYFTTLHSKDNILVPTNQGNIMEDIINDLNSSDKIDEEEIKRNKMLVIKPHFFNKNQVLTTVLKDNKNNILESKKANAKNNIRSSRNEKERKPDENIENLRFSIQIENNHVIKGDIRGKEDSIIAFKDQPNKKKKGDCNLL